jgi:hypothetical protein
MFVGLFNSVREKLVRPVVPHAANTMTESTQSKGIDRPSLVGTLIKDADRYRLSDRESAWVAAMT